MNTQIRRVGITMVIAFIAVFLQLNYVQIFAAEEIAGNGANPRALLRRYSIKRGDILTRDQVEIATSKPSKGRFKFQRTYPFGELYGHITGYYAINHGASRIEAVYNDQLLGDSGVLSMQDIEDRLFNSGEEGDDVRLTIHSRLQEAARAALGDERGAVVALEPSTGEIKAMWSNPSFDPSGLATFDGKEEQEYWDSLDPASPNSPLVSAATSRTYPPGSTFKVVTTAAALESGRYDRGSTFRDPVELELPLSNETLTNFSKTSCADGIRINLFDALRISCDTTYAILGLEIPDEIFDMAEAFGFNSELTFDLGNAASVYPDVPAEAAPLRAYAAIGQGDNAATPLQMALVAAGVANGGEVPRPQIVKDIIDPAGGIVRRFEPEMIGRAMSEAAARAVTEMMIAVVENGTGTTAQMPGIQVAGKTGTAQNVKGAAPHAWFIAFAPAEDPQIAVAVFVESGGSVGAEATGATVAAPIARQVMEADRQISNW